MMTKKEYMEMCEGEYGSISELDNVMDFYEREKKFAEIMRGLSRRLLESNISDVSTSDRRKKKRSAHLEK